MTEADLTGLLKNAFLYGPGFVLNVVMIWLLIRYTPRLIESHITFMATTSKTQTAQAEALGHLADGIEALATGEAVRPHTENARKKLSVEPTPKLT